MADFPLSRCFAAVALSFLVFCYEISAADPSSSFSFEHFGEGPSFEADIALYGDAMVVNGGSSIRLTDSVSYSSGRVVYKKPIKLVEGKSENSVSFSTYFSFSTSNKPGDNFAFVILPSPSGNNSSLGFPAKLAKDQTGVVAVEFDTSPNATKYGDLNENHVAVVVSGSVSEKISNLSSINLVLNSEEKLHSWIDYEASSKRLEIRLSKFGDTKPIDPLISYFIDLSEMWTDKELLVGLSSSNGNSSQTCYLHSWSFNLRHFPHWLHSYPIDPNNAKPEIVLKRKDMVLQVLTCFVTTFGSTALMFSAMLYLWNIFRRRNQMMVVPEECALKTKDFEYKKVEVVVGNKADQEYSKN